MIQKTVRTLGVLYFVTVTSLGGCISIISFVYDKIGLYNLGQVNNMLIYVGFLFGNPFSRKMLSSFGELKNTIVVGQWIYSLTILAAVLTYSCYSLESRTGICSLGFLRYSNYFAHVVRGIFGAPFVWTAQFMFIDRITTKDNKKEMLASFNQLLMLNGLFSNAFNLIFYSFGANSLFCFIGFYMTFCIGVIGLWVMLPEIKNFDPEFQALHGNAIPIHSNGKSAETPLLPPDSSRKVSRRKSTLVIRQSFYRDSMESSMYAKYQENFEDDEKNPIELLEKTAQEKPKELASSEDISAVECLKRFWSMANDQRILHMHPVFMMSGIYTGFLVAMLYRQVVATLGGKSEATIKSGLSLMWILYTLSCQLMTSRTKSMSPEQSKIYLRRATVFGAVALFYSFFVSEHILSFPITLLYVCTLGIVDIALNLAVSISISENFPGEIDAFTVFKQVQCIFTSAFIILYVYFSYSVFSISVFATYLLCCVWFLFKGK